MNIVANVKFIIENPDKKTSTVHYNDGSKQIMVNSEAMKIAKIMNSHDKEANKYIEDKEQQIAGLKKKDKMARR